MINNKRTEDICLIFFCRRASIISAFLIVVLLPCSANAFDLLLGSGETGSFSHFTARTICRIINRHAEDIHCKLVPAPDDVYNLTNLQGGSLDIVLIDSLMLHDAVGKTGYFEFMDIRYDNLRTVIPLYDVPIVLVVRRDAQIHSLEELKGKRINAGAPRSLEHLAMDTIMEAKNWSEKDFGLIQELPASQSQDTMAFCHGNIQALVHIGIHPDPSLRQLFRLCSGGLLNMQDPDIEKRVNTHPAFLKTVIAGDTYSSQPDAVITFGTRMLLVASGDLDEQTVYQITAALYRHQKTLARAHPALSEIGSKSLETQAIGIPLHPGAVKYFKEKGL